MVQALRMATTSAWAVGSLVAVTRFEPVATHLAVAHDDRAERASAAGEDVLGRQGDGLLHEDWVSLHAVAYP